MHYFYKNLSKMKSIKLLLVILAFVLGCGVLSAQTQTYLNLGLSLPTGDFADGDENEFAPLGESKEGGAGIGANLGFKWVFPTKAKGLGILLSLDGIYNGLNQDVKDAFDDMVDEYEEEGADVTLRKPNYINVPLMLGVNYCYEASDNFGIYGEAGLGLDARFITKFNLELEASGYDYYGDRYSLEETVTYKYDPAVAFAFQLGAGVLINKRFTIGVNLYNLGSSKIKGKYTDKYKEYYDGEYYSESEKENFKYKTLSTTMVLLRFGIRL